MKVIDKNEDHATVTLTYDEVYLLLQCCAETGERLDESDVQAIIGVTLAEIDAKADELNSLKLAMRP